MRIATLLAAGTEMVAALGLGQDLVAISHECTYPPEVLRYPRVTRSCFDPDRMSSREIDRIVRDHYRRGQNLYEIDRARLRDLRPELVITQVQCDVCAVSREDCLEAVGNFEPVPEVVALSAQRFSDVREDLRRVGDAARCRPQADELIQEFETRRERVRAAVAEASYRPRVLSLEWMDPPMVAGHWMSDMIQAAGGQDGLGDASHGARTIDWQEVVRYDPEVILVIPCGYDRERVQREMPLLEAKPGWRDLAAVRNGRLHPLSGERFHNSGPRLIDGLELLATLLHPEKFSLPGGPTDG